MLSFKVSVNQVAQQFKGKSSQTLKVVSSIFRETRERFHSFIRTNSYICEQFKTNLSSVMEKT